MFALNRYLFLEPFVALKGAFLSRILKKSERRNDK